MKKLTFWIVIAFAPILVWMSIETRNVLFDALGIWNMPLSEYYSNFARIMQQAMQYTMMRAFAFTLICWLALAIILIVWQSLESERT